MEQNDYYKLRDEVLSHKCFNDQLSIIERIYGLKDAISILRQIYAQNNLLIDNDNEYLKFFIYLLYKKYDLSGNILEIGGGVYPVLANYINMYQRKIGAGTITVMDPRLGISKLGEIKLVKDYFYKNCDISEYDLIISQSPCIITHDVIDSAIDNGKEFFVTLCKCLIDKYPYMLDFYSDDYGFDSIQDKILNEKRERNRILRSGKNLFIDSGTIFYGQYSENEMKYISGKKLIK